MQQCRIVIFISSLFHWNAVSAWWSIWCVVWCGVVWFYILLCYFMLYDIVSNPEVLYRITWHMYPYNKNNQIYLSSLYSYLTLPLLLPLPILSLLRLLGAASWTMRYGLAEKRPNPTPPILTSKGQNHSLTRVLVFVQGSTLPFRILWRYLSYLLLNFYLSFHWSFLFLYISFSLHFNSFIPVLNYTLLYSSLYFSALLYSIRFYSLILYSSSTYSLIYTLIHYYFCRFEHQSSLTPPTSW